MSVLWFSCICLLFLVEENVPEIPGGSMLYNCWLLIICLIHFIWLGKMHVSYVIIFYDVPKWGCKNCQVIWVWRNFSLSACLLHGRRMTFLIPNLWLMDHNWCAAPWEHLLQHLGAGFVASGTSQMGSVSIHHWCEGFCHDTFSLHCRNWYKTSIS